MSNLYKLFSIPENHFASSLVILGPFSFSIFQYVGPTGKCFAEIKQGGNSYITLLQFIYDAFNKYCATAVVFDLVLISHAVWG